MVLNFDFDSRTFLSDLWDRREFFDVSVGFYGYLLSRTGKRKPSDPIRVLGVRFHSPNELGRHSLLVEIDKPLTGEVCLHVEEAAMRLFGNFSRSTIQTEAFGIGWIMYRKDREIVRLTPDDLKTQIDYYEEDLRSYYRALEKEI